MPDEAAAVTRAVDPRDRTAGATIRELVAAVRDALARAGIENASAEARDLVAAVADEPRFWPSLHPDVIADEELAARARAAARLRARGAPFAYAVGRAAFRHLTLLVDERVLIPRQETEVLVDAVLEAVGGTPGGVAVDVGTGSGAIAIALAAEGRFDRVIGTDISRGALEVAAANVDRCRAGLRAPVELRAGSLLQPVQGERARVVVSNPPYIAYEEAAELPAEVHDWEPPVALFAARGGMAATAVVIAGAGAVLEPGGLLAMEVDSRRASLTAELALARGEWRDVRIVLDLAGRERILLARRKDG